MKSIRDFLARAGMSKTTPLADVIRNLRFGDETKFRNAAVLLFGKSPQRFFVEAKVKCARFDGESLTRFLDERTIEGGILHQLEETMAFVTRNTRQALVVTGKPAHEVVPEYPETAVREAVTNALCHRNYTAVGTIQIRIHDNRLEVWNPGTLPADLSIRALYGPHASHPRNPLLAAAIFRTRLIEQWGTGTLRIIEACRPFGIAVEFETGQGFFIARLKRPAPGVQPGVKSRLKSRLESRLESKPGVQPGAQPGAQPGVQPGVQSPMSVDVLKVLQSGEAGKKSIALALGKPGRTRYLNELMRSLLNAGLVEYTIPDKPTSPLQKYRLTPRGRKLLSREN